MAATTSRIPRRGGLPDDPRANTATMITMATRARPRVTSSTRARTNVSPEATKSAMASTLRRRRPDDHRLTGGDWSVEILGHWSALGERQVRALALAAVELAWAADPEAGVGHHLPRSERCRCRRPAEPDGRPTAG
jgi:hypothetical protein